MEQDETKTIGAGFPLTGYVNASRVRAEPVAFGNTAIIISSGDHFKTRLSDQTMGHLQPHHRTTASSGYP